LVATDKLDDYSDKEIIPKKHNNYEVRIFNSIIRIYSTELVICFYFKKELNYTEQ